MNEQIHLFSGLADDQARSLGLETELARFAGALEVSTTDIQVHDMLAITSGRVAIPDLNRIRLAIIGGSPECILESTDPTIKNERELVRSLLKSADKVFAICYGFQLLTRALGGVIGKANPPERGFREVSFLRGHRTLEMVPNNGLVSTFHSDAVHALPDELESITKDDGSGIQMAVGRIGTTEICGTQFHPEILTARPDLLIQQLPTDVSAVVRTRIDQAIVGHQVLRNFRR